jgi:4-amino-4-deoxy-L-arabinose transferase-like glycosyltransferase
MGPTLARIGLGLVLLVGALARWTWPVDVQDLRPRPDALEYEEAARNLATGEGYCLILDGERYPPRYPPGFSALLVPAMWFTKGEPGAGIWVVLASALVGIIATWALGLLTGGPASAVAASLLLALAPLHVQWSRAVMADVPAATFTTLLVLATIRCATRKAGPRAWLGLGVAVGLSALLRLSGAMIALPIAVAAATQRGSAGARGARLVAFGTGVAIGALPTAVYGLLRFGSPLKSGYDYWVVARFFGWDYAVDHPAGGGTAANLTFYAHQLAGLGRLYAWPVAALAAISLVVGLRRGGPTRMLAGLTAGTSLVLLATYLPFFWQSDRFLLPALPLVSALAAVPVGRDVPPWLRIASLALCLVAVAGAVREPRAFAPPDRPLGEVAALRAIGARVEPDAVLIARSDFLLVSRLFRAGTDRLWVPVGLCEHRAVVRQWKLRPYGPAGGAHDWVRDVVDTPFDSAGVEAGIRELLASGRPVYFAPMLLFQVPFARQLTTLLASRFGLDPVATTPSVGLARVRLRP